MRVGFVHESWLAHEHLGSREIGFLATLATYANREGLCWPSIKRLAQDLKTIPKVIRAILAKISEKAPEVLEVERTRTGYRFRLVGHEALFPPKGEGVKRFPKGGSNGTPNTYIEHLSPPNPPTDPDDPEEPEERPRRDRRKRRRKDDQTTYHPNAADEEAHRRAVEAFKADLEARGHDPQRISSGRRQDMALRIRHGGPAFWWEAEYPADLIRETYAAIAARMGVPPPND